jgi:glutamine amidotransferase
MTASAGARIAVVDYGMGNRRSVEKALARVGATVSVTRDADELRAADGLLVPGVGAFPAAMRALRELGLDALIRERAGAGIPVFGACLGMQLLFEASAEHEGEAGLALLEGEVRRLDGGGLKLPHIGWNEVRWAHAHPLVRGLPDPSTFYHVHTFVPHPARQEDVLGVSDYGTRFASVIARGNVFGAQFHPEKSSTHGLVLLANFAGLCAPAAASAAA